MEITNTDKLNKRCQQVVKAVDAYAIGCKELFKNELTEISISPDDYVNIALSLGLDMDTKLTRGGIRLIPAPL